jgi:hypothetical protein
MSDRQTQLMLMDESWITVYLSEADVLLSWTSADASTTGIAAVIKLQLMVDICFGRRSGSIIMNVKYANRM